MGFNSELCTLLSKALGFQPLSICSLQVLLLKYLNAWAVIKKQGASTLSSPDTGSGQIHLAWHPCGSGLILAMDSLPSSREQDRTPSFLLCLLKNKPSWPAPVGSKMRHYIQRLFHVLWTKKREGREVTKQAEKTPGS